MPNNLSPRKTQITGKSSRGVYNGFMIFFLVTQFFEKLLVSRVGKEIHLREKGSEVLDSSARRFGFLGGERTGRGKKGAKGGRK